MATASPWGITASVTKTAGYTWPVCVRCTNGGQTVDLDNWTITQLAQVAACSGTVSFVIDTVVPVSEALDSTTTA